MDQYPSKINMPDNSNPETEDIGDDTATEVVKVLNLQENPKFSLADLQPGVNIEGFTENYNVNMFDWEVQSLMRRHIMQIVQDSDGKLGHSIGAGNALPVSEALTPKRFYGKLNNFRALVLEPSAITLKGYEQSDYMEGAPAVSLLFLADMHSTGRGLVGIAAAKRDMAVVVRTNRQYIHDPVGTKYARLAVQTDSKMRQITHELAARLVEESRYLGHVAVAEAMRQAFRGGIPGLGKKY